MGDEMKIAIPVTVILCLVLTSTTTSATLRSHKLAEVKLYDYGWQADIGFLDRLASEMQTDKDSVGYVILYGGQRQAILRSSVFRRIIDKRGGFVSHRHLPGKHGGRVINTTP